MRYSDSEEGLLSTSQNPTATNRNAFPLIIEEEKNDNTRDSLQESQIEKVSEFIESGLSRIIEPVKLIEKDQKCCIDCKVQTSEIVLLSNRFDQLQFLIKKAHQRKPTEAKRT